MKLAILCLTAAVASATCGTDAEIAQTDSHTQGSDVFLKGAYVELGMNKEGFYLSLIHI